VARTGSTPPRTAVGFTIKTGWTCAVLIAGGATPRVLDRTRLDLSDPAIPESRQPYHVGFGTARKAGRELSQLIASVKSFGHHSVVGLLDRYHAEGHQLAGVGIVVGSLIDPERLANEHMRIHGLEGQLFRRVVEDAVAGRGLAPMVCRERDIYGLAETRLRKSSQAIRDEIAAIGKAAAGPWRAEHKMATIAAWLVLAGGRVALSAPTARQR
jgi:hypothetical protein